jgi:hypothetical protein
MRLTAPLRLISVATLATTTSMASGLIASNDADAFQRRSYSYEDGAVIVAHSRYLNGSISGPVRAAKYGWEVRLPGGTWVSCRRSCEETLRVETVDLNENQDELIGRGTLLNECGVFGCLDITYPR